ncbi:pyrroline-5-carboxylate reductase [Sandaracinobacter neustonicus]|uniref:Pyrroline-5-carboxylate reductase n=1 Tax=Sandaracinobacter neustonicus TaxID=1715348 RepID=A0A501XSL7_9SPHN|nr:pyrroline-5-carboxylate reductase [Sandaracinobacter neustonicus]TPE63661.1 pyrroline-5-carboxylate reductase [Sandaracinobacter neustonicus]
MFHFQPDPVPPLLSRLWLVGCGAMGGALLSRWLESGLPGEGVTVIDPAPRGLPEPFAGRVVANAAEAGDAPSLVVLGIKPQMLGAIGPGVAAVAGAAPVLSMMAGVRIAALQALFAGPVLRMMPNTPAQIGQGVTALFSERADPVARAGVEWLANAAGSLLWLEEEAQFDAVTALSGSGPAYLFRFIEALASAAEAVGLPAAMARQLALDTVTGSAALAAQSDLSPAALREQVTSPNGTTAAGLQQLDGDGLLTSLMRATVRAATERSRQMAEAAEAVPPKTGVAL